MDVCVLRCTLGHISKYMSRTNNNYNTLIRVYWVLFDFIGFNGFYAVPRLGDS